MKRKTRKEKAVAYENKYNGIPLNYHDRLNWLYDNLKINDKLAWDIICKKDEMMCSLYYNELNIILYEEPEGSPRPRFRLVNRYNLINQAISNPNFVHVYSPAGAEDNMYMKRLMTSSELLDIESLIYTPCDVEFCLFIKTPSAFSKTDIILSEIGLIRPATVKPDWDNAGKKYSDMFNNNIWLDDVLVIDGTARKFYSVLPRVEIKLKYLNMLYNKYQYKSISSRTNNPNINYFGGENHV